MPRPRLYYFVTTTRHTDESEESTNAEDHQEPEIPGSSESREVKLQKQRQYHHEWISRMTEEQLAKHREKGRLATERYRKRHPERVKAYKDRKKKDPVFQAKNREYYKRYYARKKQAASNNRPADNYDSSFIDDEEANQNPEQPIRKTPARKKQTVSHNRLTDSSFIDDEEDEAPRSNQNPEQPTCKKPTRKTPARKKQAQERQPRKSNPTLKTRKKSTRRERYMREKAKIDAMPDEQKKALLAKKAANRRAKRRKENPKPVHIVPERNKRRNAKQPEQRKKARARSDTPRIMARLQGRVQRARERLIKIQSENGSETQIHDATVQLAVAQVRRQREADRRAFKTRVVPGEEARKLAREYFKEHPEAAAPEESDP